MVRYMKCPRCELNYIDAEKQEYCDICIKEMRGIRTDIDDEFEDEEAAELSTVICPVCRENILRPGEKMCDDCRQRAKLDEEREDDEDDDEWREYLDDGADDIDDEIEDIGETFDEDELEEEEEEEFIETEEEDLEYVTVDEIYSLTDDDDDDDDMEDEDF